MTMTKDSASACAEYDESLHDPIMSLDEVEVGDRIGNWAAGECWVESKLDSGVLVVRYTGVHIASGEAREYHRTDPVGFRDTLKPFFWRNKDVFYLLRQAAAYHAQQAAGVQGNWHALVQTTILESLAEITRLRAELTALQETYRIEVKCPEYDIPEWSSDTGWNGIRGLEAARIVRGWAYEQYGYEPYQVRIVRESDNVVIDEQEK